MQNRVASENYYAYLDVAGSRRLNVRSQVGEVSDRRESAGLSCSYVFNGSPNTNYNVRYWCSSESAKWSVSMFFVGV